MLCQIPVFIILFLIILFLFQLVFKTSLANVHKGSVVDVVVVIYSAGVLIRELAMERDRDLLSAASALSARSSAASKSKAAFLYLAPREAAAASASSSCSLIFLIFSFILSPFPAFDSTALA